MNGNNFSGLRTLAAAAVATNKKNSALRKYNLSPHLAPNTTKKYKNSKKTKNSKKSKNKKRRSTRRR